MPSNNLILCHPLLLPPSIFPSIRVFSNESILHIRWPKYGVSASASVLTMNIQDWFPLDGLVGSSCSPRDSQEYYPTPKFKCINFSVVSFLYSPTLMSVHDYWKNHSFDSVQFSLSVMSDSLRPHEPPHARLPCPSPTPGVHPNPCPLSQWCHPTISSCCPLLHLPSIFPSIRVFSNESALHIRWSKYWSFSFNISPSNEHPGLISFRMDLLDLLAVQGTLKSLLQHHSSKASILLYAAFFIVQFSHLYMTTGKIIALTRQTFVGKAMSLHCIGLS